MTIYSSKVIRLSFLMSLFYLSLLGCTSSPSNEKSADRAATSFREKIIGHWITETGHTEYYVGLDSIFMVERGRISRLRYSIYESNEADRTMAIQVFTPSGSGHNKQLKFSPNFRSLAEIVSIEMNGETTELSTKWIYLNSEDFTEDQEVLDYRRGVEEGCASKMKEKNNSESDIKIFCSCFSDTLVDGLSKEDRTQLAKGDKKFERSIFSRNFYKTPMCEKNLSKNAKF